MLTNRKLEVASGFKNFVANKNKRHYVRCHFSDLASAVATAKQEAEVKEQPEHFGTRSAEKDLSMWIQGREEVQLILPWHISPAASK